MYVHDLIKNTQGLPECVREHRFDANRKWRFDFAFPSIRVAIECEGTTHTGGRHQRMQGYANDCEKYNAAQMQGWQVFRITQLFIKEGRHFKQLDKIIKHIEEAYDDNHKQ